MSNRPQIKPDPIFTNTSMATSQISKITILSQASMCSYSFSWVGTSPVGTITVQVSDDYYLLPSGQPGNAATATWNTLPLSSTPAVTGNTGNGMIDILQTGTYAIRAIYTAVSGTGSLNGTMTAKVA